MWGAVVGILWYIIYFSAMVDVWYGYVQRMIFDYVQWLMCGDGMCYGWYD